MPIEFRSRIPLAKAQAKAAITEATQETFELDIKPDAVERSPVTAEGFEHNVELGRKRPGGTGTNRRSIDTETVETEQGPKATLFTQSGYGGYLEVGTSKMRAQPYLYPAFIENVDKIPERVKEKIAASETETPKP
jgi:HK97 gp10 family phage protein